MVSCRVWETGGEGVSGAERSEQEGEGREPGIPASTSPVGRDNAATRACVSREGEVRVARYPAEHEPDQ